MVVDNNSGLAAGLHRAHNLFNLRRHCRCLVCSGADSQQFDAVVASAGRPDGTIYQISSMGPEQPSARTSFC